MKKVQSILLIIYLAIGFTGCGYSVQHVLKPDIEKPLNDTESIIQLKRADHIIGSGRKYSVISNDTLIGEVANGDEVVWKTKADSLECITIGTDKMWSDSLFGIRFDDTPYAYKCFTTKPKEILLLNFDFFDKSRTSVSPVFKNISKSKVVPISINSITNSVKTESSNDLILLLDTAIKKQFKNNLVSKSGKTIDLEILDYKTGNAAARWLAQSYSSSTFAKIKVIIKENNVVTDTYITRPVISYGGFMTVGGDTLIFDYIAKDIYFYMFPY